MPNYTTPGVWVEEVPTLAPSVAQVATAIPAFIGYTAKGSGVDRIASLLEYEAKFGKARPATFEATVDGQRVSLQRTDRETNPFLMHYALSLYFRNGGGACYVVSVGNYPATPAQEDFEHGLAQLEKEDEPTLIVLADAVCLGQTAYYDLCQQALAQAAKLGDRFVIVDLPRDRGDVSADIAALRTAIGGSHLSYGAAYHPYLQTTLAVQYAEQGVTVLGLGDGASGPASPPAPRQLDEIRTTHSALYNRIKAALAEERVVLPPSPAVAGVYVRVDGERGVWKAPANAGVAAVLGPVTRISNEEQGALNVDPDGGKSINAIRAFSGKGTLIWGARTLAGNDNEWRYVPVRRLFLTIEESTRKASSFAVFETNDATTWLKVKAMIDSYLYGLWEQGALAGSKPEEAYFVSVGLGRTMTAEDIAEGRLIVEIGVAAVRPAEFIVLRFSHRMQEA